MALKTVYGIICFDSENNIIINSGSGDFSVSYSEEGLYIVTFDQEFNSTPSVTTTQIYASNGSNTEPSLTTGTPGSTRDNSVIVYITSESFKVSVGEGDGDRKDRMVSFIAVGLADG